MEGDILGLLPAWKNKIKFKKVKCEMKGFDKLTLQASFELGMRPIHMQTTLGCSAMFGFGLRVFL
jgi:hypothetical protein